MHHGRKRDLGGRPVRRSRGRRDSRKGKGPGQYGADLGRTSQDWDELTDLPTRRRPGAAKRAQWWYDEHGIDEDDREALLESSRRLIAAEGTGDDEPEGFGRGRRPAARSDYYREEDDDLDDFDDGFLFI
ncbi:hypothetical protein M3B14_05425 [Kocuria marina]|uniref:hypothetical protein n=1 Tax=Kocuria marina TaxID=223184 RepID=UPI002989DB2F|nr:hypothetical protein [Kocuria marina]MCT1723067.1 hypothetical protein [Kocuria marina]MCT1734116.1 hypothetical protein [Kocuria marina]